MISTSCPYCGTAAHHLLDARDFNRHIDNEVFQYYQCPQDGLVFLHPIPADLGQYYPSSYYSLDVEPATLRDAYQATEGYKIELLNQFAPGKRLLEIGPGSGGFMFLAQEAGYDPTAIEMDKTVCDFLSTKIGITTINTTDVTEGLANLGQFDAIVLWHVIEHMPDAWNALHVLSRHLATNGVLILAAPNPDALQFKIFGKWWTHLDAPRHVYLIPAAVLEKIGKQNGLELVEKTDLDRGSLMWNRFGWRCSLRNLAHHKLQNYKIGFILDLLMRPLERRGFRGTTYTVILRKTNA